jgi:hypothetical protein
LAEGWICQEDAFPAIKWFSPVDASSSVPPVTCVRVDKHVAGLSWREWATWFKLARFLRDFPIP